MQTIFIAVLLGLLSSLPININSTASVDSTSIFYDHTSSEVKAYYSSLTDGLKGDELLSALQPILKNNQKSLPKSDVGSSWKYFVLLDRDWSKDPIGSEDYGTSWKTNNVICRPLYEDTFTFVSSASPGNSVNREHVFPKSHGFQDKSSYAPFAGTDLQNLHMGEAANNQKGHADYPYGNVADKSSATKIKSVISGNVTGYTGLNSNGITVYEPMDRDKGDIARSIFYMAARYHTYDASVSNSPALKLVDNPKDISGSVYASDTRNSPCEYGVLSDLLNWNISDPVDDYEIHRNNLVFNACQYNRNPFIDYPSWAEIAFGNSSTGISKNTEPQMIGGSSEPSLTKEKTPEATYDETTKTLANLVADSSYYLVLNDGTKLTVTSSKDSGQIVLSDYLSSLNDKTIVGLIKIGNNTTTSDSDAQPLSILIKSETTMTKEVTPAGVYDESTKSITNLNANSNYSLVFSDSTSLKVTSDASGIISLNNYLSDILNKNIVGLVKLGDNLTTIDSDRETLNILITEEVVKVKEATPKATYDLGKEVFINLIPNAKYNLLLSDKTTCEVVSDSNGIITLKDYSSSLNNKTIIGLIKLGDNLTTIDSEVESFNILYNESQHTSSFMDRYRYLIYTLSIIAVILLIIIGIIIYFRTHRRRRRRR
jgi:Endonuclease I